MTFSPQINEVHTYESGGQEQPILHHVDIADLVNKIGATLKQKVDKGDTFGRTEIDGIFYYGLIDWFDGTQPKQEYSKK